MHIMAISVCPALKYAILQLLFAPSAHQIDDKNILFFLSHEALHIFRKAQ